MKVLIDFDNAFYESNRDIDDGLALLYLLGQPGVDLLGITSIFGNHQIEKVHKSTVKLLETLNLDSALYKKGAGKRGEYHTEASVFLAEQADKHAGDITILATGALTNVYGASLISPGFFEQVNQVVLMGGITEPLVFKKQVMNELNFSCDPEATFNVLMKGKKVSVLTGNNCLNVLFKKAEFKTYFSKRPEPFSKSLYCLADEWIEDNKRDYGIDGFYNWDTLAAAYLVKPELFENDIKNFLFSEKSLETGCLVAEETDKHTASAVLNTPKVKNDETTLAHIFESWVQAVEKQTQFGK